MSKYSVAQKLILSHLIGNKNQPCPAAGQPIELVIDQTLTQDATGTLVMLEYESLGLGEVKTEVSAQYVDHNLLQSDFKNADDHIFLKTASQQFGVWFSPPGNGISHPLHMENFGRPGATLLGSDSHTCGAGALGMLAIGAGGLQVALAMAGEPYNTTMPKIMGVRLEGHLPPWVSAKDIILEMLRRYGTAGGVGKIVEYYGPGLEKLSAMDRHVIANMGQELGATSSVFPADEAVRAFMAARGREQEYQNLIADEGCQYDEHDTINLSHLQPLIAFPGSPGDVVPVSEVAGKDIFQAYIGSSANPGLRDYHVAAHMVKNSHIAPGVSFDVNPSMRSVLQQLTEDGTLSILLGAGGRMHESGCNGCIGMGQAPATGKISLRTVPRNFTGRSGTEEDSVYLCSPETATASAITGEITDPRTLHLPSFHYEEPSQLVTAKSHFIEPKKDRVSAIEKGPNIKELPILEAFADEIKGLVMLKAGDDVSTDDILPAGTHVLPLRSNIPAISRFAFSRLDESFYQRSVDNQRKPHFIIGGRNYGQGSSREHAALAPAYLGTRVVIAQSFARIHRRNLINFGILPLLFEQAGDYEKIAQGQSLQLSSILSALKAGDSVTVQCLDDLTQINLIADLNSEELATIAAGGLLNKVKARAA